MKVTVEKPTKLPQFRRKNIAAYARVSVETELSSHSLKAQVSHYSSYISQNPTWNFVGVYADEGITGTKAKRPGFQNLLRDCNAGKIDMIITKSISRFARNTVDLLDVTRNLKNKGIDILFEEENIHSMSSEGELMLSLFASFAQEESRSVSENTRWAIQKRFEQGKVLGFVMYGYKWDGREFHIIPEQAEIVREIYASYLGGMTPDQIASSLKKRGVKGPRGGDFSYSLVWSILRLERYKGDSLLQKTYRKNHLTKQKVRNTGEKMMYYVDGTHPPIVSAELFDAVQAEIKRRAELGYLANQSLTFSCFTGKLVCGKCGRTYRRRVGGIKRYKNRFYRWTCGKRIDGTSSACDAQNVPEKALYEITSDVLQVETLTKEVFDRSIEKIVVTEPSTLTFHMKDGSLIERRWTINTPNSKIREAVNGKTDTSD